MVKGDRYTLPADFVNGLAFLRPLLPRHGDWFDTQVNLLGGKLNAVTNQLIVEYDASNLELPNRCFSSKMIRMLEAFHTLLTEVFSEGIGFHFCWDDGQELYLWQSQAPLPGSNHQRLAEESFSRFWNFNEGTKITAQTRRYLRKLINRKKASCGHFHQWAVDSVTNEQRRQELDTAKLRRLPKQRHPHHAVRPPSFLKHDPRRGWNRLHGLTRLLPSCSRSRPPDRAHVDLG